MIGFQNSEYGPERLLTLNERSSNHSLTFVELFISWQKELAKRYYIQSLFLCPTINMLLYHSKTLCCLKNPSWYSSSAES